MQPVTRRSRIFNTWNEKQARYPPILIYLLISSLFSFNEFFVVEIYRYLQENEALGTAGGLFEFRQQILPEGVTHFFVLHADTCCTFPLQELLTFHLGHK